MQAEKMTWATQVTPWAAVKSVLTGFKSILAANAWVPHYETNAGLVRHMD